MVVAPRRRPTSEDGGSSSHRVVVEGSSSRLATLRRSAWKGLWTPFWTCMPTPRPSTDENECSSCVVVEILYPWKSRWTTRLPRPSTDENGCSTCVVVESLCKWNRWKTRLPRRLTDESGCSSCVVVEILHQYESGWTIVQGVVVRLLRFWDLNSSCRQMKLFLQGHVRGFLHQSHVRGTNADSLGGTAMVNCNFLFVVVQFQRSAHVIPE
jgi:hypothetical protein